ncbi:MAG: Coq4 family protein [Flavobacteriales bacterium]
MNFVFQSTFYYNLRVKICDVLNKYSVNIYTSLFKQKEKEWDININKLQAFKPNSIGYKLFLFLRQEQFEIMPKHESHDVFHILGNYGTSKEEEIALQFFLFGNGKKSIYLFLSLIIGIVLFPEYVKMFKKAYHRGQQALPFYKIDFEKLLHYPIQNIQKLFMIYSRTQTKSHFYKCNKYEMI